MDKKSILIYVSDNCEKSDALLTHMKKWNVNYETRNISRNKEYLEELQSKGVFGTPATFIEGEQQPVLGFQKNEIKHILGLSSRGFTDGYFSKGNY
jgi:glutaredoxin